MRTLWESIRTQRRRPSPVSLHPDWWLACAPDDLAGAPLVWRDEQIAVARRQPAVSPRGRFVLVGDIRLSDGDALRREFSEALTDEQLAVCLWERGEGDALARLAGVFAFAVWDRERRVMTLVRDRVGARTLYYSLGGVTRWVAPRLALIAPHVARELDPVALRDYLCCAFVPGERTMWRDVREVRPGTIVRLPADETRAYWRVREQIADADESLEAHSRRLRAQLEEVVLESLPPREPVGCYLSGGLDSSCVTALAARLHSSDVHTYSIHFGHETPHELEFSSLVAEHCGTRHHVIEITPGEMWGLLPEAMAHLDDPIGDPLTVPNLILGREAKKDVNVILNGEGGDPCFGGPKNQPMLLTSLYQPALGSNSAGGSLGNGEADLLSAYLASFQKCSPDLPRLLRPEVAAVALGEPSVFKPELHGAGSYLNRLMFINTKFKGADHILTKVSNLTRACGLEGRSPLFDQRVVELSLGIPPQFKLHGAEEKAVLKTAVADLLPERILSRPKSGMMVPVQLWFRRHWQRQARALLLSRRARIRPYLNQEVIREWLDYRGDTWARYGVKLWLVVSLELWLRAHEPH
jgi:asparagine synthase (glutamine-hydrolysing)